jgi:hypothetical protein
MNRLTGIPVLILAGVLMVFASGCISQDTTLPPEEQAAIRAYADPITDNLLQGFNDNNYTLYSRDFSSEMKQGLDAAAFEQNRALILSKIGLYMARGEPLITQNGDYLAANYKADFEQEQAVDVRVIFKKGDDAHQVYGLWFNSPKLRS